MEKLEKICIHKGEGCNKEDVCDGRGSYEEGEETKKCYRNIYDESDLWEQPIRIFFTKDI